MTIFEKISDTRQQIEEIKEKIMLSEVQACSPKSGKITGMPQGGGDVVNPIDKHLERKERLEGRLRVLEDKLSQQWEQALHLMKKARIDEQTQKMMYYRFYWGIQWKKCAEKLDKKYPDCKWNENKCFRKYREVLTKISYIA